MALRKLVMIEAEEELQIASVEDAISELLRLKQREYDATDAIREQKREQAEVRFQMGRIVHHVLDEADYGENAMDQIKAATGFSHSYLHESKWFYLAHEKSVYALRAWMDEVEDRRGQVNWGHCRNWARKQLKGEDHEEDTNKVEEEKRRLERRARRLEEDAMELERQIHEQNEAQPDEEAISMARHARQVAEDTRDQMERMQLKRYQRVEDEQYRAWVREQACVVTGEKGSDVMATDPHHAIEGGTGSKASDYTCLPLRHDLHQELHGPNMSRTAFEEKYNVDIWREIARHVTRYFTRTELV